MYLRNRIFLSLPRLVIPGMLLVFLTILSCKQAKNQKIPDQKAPKNSSAKLKTGVYKSYKDGYLVAEISFKEGVKEGPAKKYYPDGSLYSVVYFKNDIRVDTSRSYYNNGHIFRESPYLNGKIHGIQRKFYKDGSLWAEIPHERGMRKMGLKEMTKSGWPVTYYPEIVIKMSGRRSSDGSYILQISLSNQGKRVQYYKGHLENNVFDEGRTKAIPTENGIGQLKFIKTKESPGLQNISIIAIYKTPLMDKKILQKNFKIPFRNLKLINIGK